MTNSYIEWYLNLHWITKQKADKEYVRTHSGKAQLDAKLEKLNIFSLHNPFKMYIHFLSVQDHSSVGHFMQERR